VRDAGRAILGRMPRFPRLPAVGPFRERFWRSPLRGPWLASLFSSALLPLIAVCAVTGFLSHLAYQPHLGANAIFNGPGPGNGFDVYGIDWPTSPRWLYAATQGLHVVSGIAAIPILAAKLWTVIPKLFENPPVLSLAHALERLSLVLLVGGGLFTFATGVINIQLWYPFGFPFVPAHYYGAILFVAALVFHVGLKLPLMWRVFRERRWLRPLRDDLAHTRPEPGVPGVVTSAPVAPGAPTLTRRALVGGVGAASVGLGVMAAGQVVGGPISDLALLAPRGRRGSGPNGFPVNKTFAAVGIPSEQVGPAWRLELMAAEVSRVRLDRGELLRMPQTRATLPIACVEGWSTTQHWSGVRLLELARLAGVEDPDTVEVRSLQPHGRLKRVTLNRGQVQDGLALLALRVNGVDLSLDHGYPARVIVPALPGVHCTKWVGQLVFA
jgi:DMSO/TMAO reductase YedYZ molybdopterin-dependent catalytic subunit